MWGGEVVVGKKEGEDKVSEISKEEIPAETASYLGTQMVYCIHHKHSNFMMPPSYKLVFGQPPQSVVIPGISLHD